MQTPICQPFFTTESAEIGGRKRNRPPQPPKMNATDYTPFSPLTFIAVHVPFIADGEKA